MAEDIRRDAQLPPLLTYDPSIEASRRAAKRGLKDLKVDTKRAQRYLKQDWRTERKDLQTQRRRGLRDIGLQRSRGLRDIGYERTDTRLGLERGRADFATELDNLIHGYKVQGNEQAQNAAAAGVGGGAVAQASEAARAANLARSRQPLDTSMQRLEEDTATSLTRLGVAESDLLKDSKLARRDLKRDVRHDLALGKREMKRTRKDLATELDRAIREQRIGDVDSILQAIWSARMMEPGAFSRTGAPT